MFLEHGTDFNTYLLIRFHMNSPLLPTFIQKYSSPHLIDVASYLGPTRCTGGTYLPRCSGDKHTCFFVYLFVFQV